MEGMPGTKIFFFNREKMRLRGIGSGLPFLQEEKEQSRSESIGEL